MNKYGYIDSNPGIRLIQNKIKKQELPKYLDYKDINKIIAAAKENGSNSTRDVALLYCLAYCGSRRSEILKLNWSDVCFADSTITIYRDKNLTVDVLPMHEKLRSVMEELFKNTEPCPSDPVFISKKHKRLSYTAFNEMFRKCVKLSGVEKQFIITSHVFRHSFVTELIKNGVSLKEIQMFTGHKDTNSLMGYIHICTEHKMRVIETLPEISI